TGLEAREPRIEGADVGLVARHLALRILAAGDARSSRRSPLFWRAFGIGSQGDPAADVSEGTKPLGRFGIGSRRRRLRAVEAHGQFREDARHACRGVGARCVPIFAFGVVGGQLKQLGVWAVYVLPRAIAYAAERAPSKM